MVYTDAKSSLWIQMTFSPRSAEDTTVRCDAFMSNPKDTAQFENVVKEKLDGYLKTRLEYHERGHLSLLDSGCVPGELTCEAEQGLLLRHLKANSEHCS